MAKYQEAKKLVREYFDAMEKASAEGAQDVLKKYMSEDYLWRGVSIPRTERYCSSGRNFLETFERIAFSHAEKNGHLYCR